MKFIRVDKPNREEWLQWRQNGIGSSDVPVIMGVSRYKKYDQLLAEKCKTKATEDQTNKYIKDRGNRIEQTVRELYEGYMGIKFPPVSCSSVEYPHMLATLDGMDDGNNLIIEIKLLSSQKVDNINEEAEGYLKWVKAKEEGIIPIDYYPQIQHQLAVTGAPACTFLGYKEVRGGPYRGWDDVVSVSVLPDEEYISNMTIKINEFWNKVMKERK